MNLDLMATCWTSAGGVRPLDEPEVSPIPVQQRVAAVAAGGWAGIGLAQGDLEVVSHTIGFAELGAQIKAVGLRYVEVELLTDWWLDPDRWRSRWNLLVEAAASTGAGTVKLGTSFGAAVDDLSPFVAPARALAQEAADLGVRLALEPLPFALIGSIPQGAQLARQVNHASFGLCIDAWHVFRAGTSLDELAACLSPELIVSVELDDADAEPIGTLFDDTRDRRRYPGEGAFDLVGLVNVLRSEGFSGPWGVEMLSNEHRGLPLDEALDRARASALELLRTSAAPDAQP